MIPTKPTYRERMLDGATEGDEEFDPTEADQEPHPCCDAQRLEEFALSLQEEIRIPAAEIDRIMTDYHDGIISGLEADNLLIELFCYYNGRGEFL